MHAVVVRNIGLEVESDPPGSPEKRKCYNLNKVGLSVNIFSSLSLHKLRWKDVKLNSKDNLH